jgi:DNA replication and repair protein RecF
MPTPVAIHALALQQFRNHRQSRLEPGAAALVVLAGPNGAGKTNVLEALSLLAPGRGLRGAALPDMAMAAGSGGDGSLAVQAMLAPEPDLPLVAIRAFTMADAPDRRRLLVNGAAAAVASLAQWLSILWLTPAMDRLFADTASARRRFLDRMALALFPDHGRHASRYEAAMRARNRLLAGPEPADPHWLSALEAQMAEHGAALADGRRRLVMALGARLDEAPRGAFPRASLALSGDLPGADWPRMLAAVRGADAAAGRATMGPHRVDLAVTHADKAVPAAQASTGEQKALLIAILLAHAALTAAETARTPVLLLDEATAHLDSRRRHALFDQLLALGGQSWLTGTELALFPAPTADAGVVRYEVADGRVIPA